MKEPFVFQSLFLLPVPRTHGACHYQPVWKFPVSFAQEIARIFGAALDHKLRDQPDMAGLYQIGQTLFHQTDSFSFRWYIGKDLRMLCLRDTQVKISVKLLQRRIIVGMVYLRI